MDSRVHGLRLSSTVALHSCGAWVQGSGVACFGCWFSGSRWQQEIWEGFGFHTSTTNTKPDLMRWPALTLHRVSGVGLLECRSGVPNGSSNGV